MKAAVCYELGKPLVIEEIDIDDPHDGEVKVRLVATAICHSDVHAIRGDWGGEVCGVQGRFRVLSLRQAMEDHFRSYFRRRADGGPGWKWRGGHRSVSSGWGA